MNQVGLWQHFGRLFDFRGREDRASFWPYAALVFVIDSILGMLIFIPMMTRSMAQMESYAAANPGQANVTSGPGNYSVSVSGNHSEFFDSRSMAMYLAVTFGVALLLYSAAVTRRLHDRGKSGWWGLMPVPFILYSSIAMPAIFASGGQPDTSLFFSIFFSNMLYIVTLIWLIVWLASRGDEGPNRYDTKH